MTYTDWMIEQNIKYAQIEGTETVVARLRALGYNRVADGVQAAPTTPNRKGVTDVVHEMDGNVRL
jgi:hypothetical protein